MNIRIKSVWVWFFCVFSAPLFAADLKVNGMASYWAGPSEVYIATLKLDHPSTDVETIVNSQQHKQMDLRITAKKWRERDISQEWKNAVDGNNSDEQKKQYINDLHKFTALFKGPLEQGDRLVIDYTSQTVTVRLNGIELAQFEAGFFPVLLRTWLGPRLPYSSFRDQITGVDSSMAGDLRQRALAVTASAQRRDEIKQWLSDDYVANDGDDVMEKNRYRIEVTRAILRRVVYPSRALRSHEEGTSLVKIRLDGNGRLLDYSIYKSSGSKSLDKAALEAIDRAKFPAFPDSIKSKLLEFLVPVRFVLP